MLESSTGVARLGDGIVSAMGGLGQVCRPSESACRCPSACQWISPLGSAPGGHHFNLRDPRAPDENERVYPRRRAVLLNTVGADGGVGIRITSSCGDTGKMNSMRLPSNREQAHSEPAHQPSTASTGIPTVTLVPSPGMLDMLIFPPWASAIMRQVARPRPAPPCFAERARLTR